MLMFRENSETCDLCAMCHMKDASGGRLRAVRAEASLILREGASRALGVTSRFVCLQFPSVHQPEAPPLETAKWGLENSTAGLSCSSL